MCSASVTLIVAHIFVSTIAFSMGACPKILKRGVSIDDQKFIVNKHNSIREMVANNKLPGQPRGVNLKKLSWNKCLAKKAQKIADNCESDNVSDTCENFDWEGRNLFMSINASRMNNSSYWLDAILSWFDEHKDYIYGSLYSPRTENYKQIVWAETYNIGCGFSYFITKASFRYRKVYVCKYGPGSSWPTNFPYQLGTSGCEHLC
ncbi:CRISP/Allergen/PR-1-like [Aethina tumida]|uniref:CRISP/Allergen/PR-1-like n=1 Tax=Aethina tumida TaxID=116153 RepID=UPI0021478FBE|nr:CRISP/Allergen/PR-1-like [Aethina tumida]